MVIILKLPESMLDFPCRGRISNFGKEVRSEIRFQKCQLKVLSLRCITRHDITNNNLQLPDYTFVVSACTVGTLHAVHVMTVSATSVALL